MAGEDAVERYSYVVARNAITEALYGLEDVARSVMPDGTQELRNHVVEEARNHLLELLNNEDAEALR